jgi:DNA-binding NarL/FixJ family response regulator
LSGILVVDDHPVIARACGVALEPIGIETIIPAYDADTGYQAFLEHAPDISVIDLSLRRNELDGIDLIKRIRSCNAGARILVFSMRADRSTFLSAIEAGATGYLIKDSPTEEFAKAVQRIRSGRRYIALNLAFVERCAFSERAAHTGAAAGRRARRVPSPSRSLTSSCHTAVGTMASMVTPFSPDATVSVPPNASSRSLIPVRPWPNL